jgi:hypothetical protein
MLMSDFHGLTYNFPLGEWGYRQSMCVEPCRRPGEHSWCCQASSLRAVLQKTEAAHEALKAAEARIDGRKAVIWDAVRAACSR